jgi:hypothetical protein
MAIFKTSIRTAQEARKTSLHQNQSFRPLQKSLHLAEFTITLAGTEVTGDDLELGSLGLAGAVVIPELSRIIDSGGADVGGTFILEAVNAETLAVTALSAATALDNNSVAIVRLASGAQPSVAGAEDFLQLAVTSPTGASGTTYLGAAGNTITVLLAYTNENFAD